MTTASDTAAEAKVDLTAANGQTPKRRGRPPGSKNKATAAKATARRKPRAEAPVKAATPTRVERVEIKSKTVHAVLVGNEGVEVLHVDGSTQYFLVDLTGAPLFDRRK